MKNKNKYGDGNPKKSKHTALDNNRSEKTHELKSARSSATTKKQMLNEYSQTSQGAKSAATKVNLLVDELVILSQYFGLVEQASNVNFNHIEKTSAKKQFDDESKLKDIFNLRWQHEFNMFSISSFHFLVDSLSWKLWNWDFDIEAVSERIEDLEDTLEHFINSNKYDVFDENVPTAKLPIPDPVMNLWTEGSRMPAAVKNNSQGFHLADSPRGDDAHRVASWEELLNPLLTWDDKNVHVTTPTYEDDEMYSIGGVAALFETTPFNVLTMLQEDLLRTDTEHEVYSAYEVKGSVLNNFINELLEIKRIVKKTRLANYKETMKSLHGGQKSLNL